MHEAREYGVRGARRHPVPKQQAQWAPAGDCGRRPSDMARCDTWDYRGRDRGPSATRSARSGLTEHIGKAQLPGTSRPVRQAEARGRLLNHCHHPHRRPTQPQEARRVHLPVRVPAGRAQAPGLHGLADDTTRLRGRPRGNLREHYAKKTLAGLVREPGRALGDEAVAEVGGGGGGAGRPGSGGCTCRVTDRLRPATTFSCTRGFLGCELAQNGTSGRPCGNPRDWEPVAARLR